MKNKKENEYIKFLDENGNRISWEEYVVLQNIKNTIKKEKI